MTEFRPSARWVIAATLFGAIAVLSVLQNGQAGAARSLQTVSTFEGTVRIDAAPGGQEVSATVGDAVCATSPVGEGQNGQSFRFYRIEVASAEEEAGCGTEGATVSFRIDGEPAKPTAIWKAGQVQTVHIWAGADFAAFSGGLSLDGQPWPTAAGSATVEAFIGDVSCGSLTNFLFGGSSYGAVIVLPDSLRAGCGKAGDTIAFTVDGIPAEETAVWEPGFHTLDLSVGLPGTPTPPTLPATGGAAPDEGSGLPVWLTALGASLAGAGLALAAYRRLGRRT